MITITINSSSAETARREAAELLGLQMRPSGPWAWQVTKEGEIVPAVEAPAEGVAAPEAEPIEESAAEPEQPRRGRGRPRKNPVTIDGESTLVSETTTAPQEQIDLEEVIAAKAGETEAAREAEADALATTPSTVEEATTEQSQPADSEKGWTHDDAKTVARAMYVRLGTLQQHELDEKLHTNLQKFGVQRIKDLALEQIEAFVRAVEAEVA